MDPIAETLRSLAAVLDRLGIRYLVGGSLASSFRGGVTRATMNIDVVATIVALQTERLAHELGRDWYAEPDQMRRAIAAKRAFNIIYIPLAFKVDIFPATDDFHLSQLERATRARLPFPGDSNEYPVATAEDILLAKLRWYREGGEVSDRQWYDISGIVAASPALDMEYTRLWAVRLRVDDLLDKALAEAEG